MTDASSRSGYIQHNGWPPLPYGQRVKTAAESKSDGQWCEEAIPNRRWNKAGTIIMFHDSHGLCYDVAYDEGGEGSFNPEELLL